MEGITKGDPTAVSLYILRFLPLLNMTTTDSTNYATYGDDISYLGILKNVLTWWSKLNAFGPKTGYFSKAKIWQLILKPKKYEKVERNFKDEKDTVAGTKQYRKKICNHESKRMAKCIKVIKVTYPQTAYCTPVLKQKFTYFIRTMLNISQVLHLIENVIRQKFITSLFEERICKDEDSQLLRLI